MTRITKQPTTPAVNPSKINPANLAGAKLSQSDAFLKLAGQTPGSGLAGSNLANSPAFQALAQQQAAANAAQAAGAPAAKATFNPNDPAYTTGINGVIARIAAQRAQAALDQTRDDTDYGTATTRLEAARAGDLRQANSDANRQGLFFSTVLGQRRGDVDRGYNERAFDAQTAYDRAKYDRQAAVDALGGIVSDASSDLGYHATGTAQNDLAALFSEAYNRQLARDRGDA